MMSCHAKIATTTMLHHYLHYLQHDSVGRYVPVMTQKGVDSVIMLRISGDGQ